jgi:hypothetical protein
MAVAAAMSLGACANTETTPEKVASAKPLDPPAPLQATAPATEPAVTLAAARIAPAPPCPAVNHFVSRSDGIAIDYPTGWQTTRIQHDLSTLRVQLPSGVAHFTLNIPNLPWHPEWLLTMDRVKSKYLEDRRKQRFTAGATVTEEPSVSIPGAQVEHLKMHGPFQGRPYFEEAVMIIHDNRVYILDISGNDSGYPAAHALLDEVLKSLKWVS